MQGTFIQWKSERKRELCGKRNREGMGDIAQTDRAGGFVAEVERGIP